MDFTISKYKLLLNSLQNAGYSFQTLEQFILSPDKKVIILRHDVDRLPYNSLKTAQIENELGIKGSYYIRIIPKSYNESIIKQIVNLGHEIGYHYENLTSARGDVDKAYDSFCKDLITFQKIYPVKTICMHGSPMSKYDSRKIWEKYDYKRLGIIGEPYFDIDFSKVFYLTDTGRMWDGYKVSIRDKIMNYQYEWNKQGLSFHYTDEIIKAVKLNVLPEIIMFTFHPQRWNSSFFTWLKELVLQNLKNQVKRFLVSNNK